MKATTTVTLFIITFLTAAGWSTVDVNAGDSLSFLCLGCRCNCCTNKAEPIIEPEPIEQPRQQPIIEQPIIEQPIIEQPKQPITGDFPLAIDLKHIDGTLAQVVRIYDNRQLLQLVQMVHERNADNLSFDDPAVMSAIEKFMEHERNSDDLSSGDPAAMSAFEKFMGQHERNSDDLSSGDPAAMSAFEKFMERVWRVWRGHGYWGSIHWGTSNLWGDGPDYANFIDYAHVNDLRINWINWAKNVNFNLNDGNDGKNEKNGKNWINWIHLRKNNVNYWINYYWIHWIHWIHLRKRKRKHNDALTIHVTKKKKNGGQCVSACNMKPRMGDICVAVGLSTVLFFSMVLILRVFRNLERQKKTSRKTHVFQIDDLGGVSKLPG